MLKRKQSQGTLLALISKNNRMASTAKSCLVKQLEDINISLRPLAIFICFCRSFVCLQAKSKALE